MQCVILAGGRGTRLGELTADRPKAMVLVGGKPFLYHQFQLLRDQGIGDIVICAGYLGERIEEHFGSGRSFGVRLVYSREDGRLLGTGGALRQALPLLEEEFLLLYGDSYLEVDYRSVFAYFSQVDQPVLMTVFRNKNRWVKSNVCFRNGKVTAFDKGHGGRGLDYIDYGLSVFSREIVREIAGGEPFSLDRIYSRLAGEGRLAGLEVFRRFYEIGTPAGLEELREYLEEQPSR